MKSRPWVLAPVFLLLVSLAGFRPAAAQGPTVDGQLDADFYGAPLAVQEPHCVVAPDRAKER